MDFVTPLKSLFLGDEYTINVDSSLIMESFYHNGFSYIRTPTKYFKKPNHKRLYKKTSKSDFDFSKSDLHTQINRSQAKGLLKLTQLEFPL